MVTKGYICDVCGKAGTNLEAITEHESIPIKELTVGGLYKVKKEYALDRKIILLVAGEEGINEKHFKRYYDEVRNVKENPLKIEKSLFDASMFSGNLSRLLEELSEQEFERYKNELLKDEQFRVCHNHLTISRGILPKI